MKLIIAGSRGIPPEAVVRYLEDETFFHLTVKEVVCGMAKGPDLAGKHWAEMLNKQGINIKVKEFPADWDTHGKAAGFFRNEQMAFYADELLAFWDGKSRGTKDMIQRMLKFDKPFQVVLMRP